MRMWRAEDGNLYPVGDMVTAAIDGVFGTNWPDYQATRLLIYAIQNRSSPYRPIERDRRMRLEAWLMGCHGNDVRRAREHAARFDNLPPALLHAEQSRHLQACDAIINMNNSIAFLRGRDFREIFETIDQVHGNASRGFCGCVTSTLFDHHLAREGKPYGVYWHYPLEVCERHAHLVEDWQAHYVAVYRHGLELQKNVARRAGLRLVRAFGDKLEDRILRRFGIRARTMKLAA